MQTETLMYKSMIYIKKKSNALLKSNCLKLFLSIIKFFMLGTQELLNWFPVQGGY